MSCPNNLYDILLRVWHKGLIPLVAHPERYMYMEERDYHKLKAHGYELQLNLLSLSGYYGLRPRLVAERLLEVGLYDNIGTDLHHLDRFEDHLWELKLTRRQIDAVERLFDNNTRL
jgi:tyrosine-protein phosphatase YwqE